MFAHPPPHGRVPPASASHDSRDWLARSAPRTLVHLSARINLNEMVPRAQQFAHQSHLHGQAHVARVMVHAFRLIDATGMIQYGPALWAAVYLHDMARRHDGVCHRHGADAVDMLRSTPALAALFERGGVRDGDRPAIETAVIQHCRLEELPEDHPHRRLTALLKDADALDRVRLAGLDPSYLRHREAVHMVDFAKALFTRSARLTPGRDDFEHLLSLAAQLACGE